MASIDINPIPYEKPTISEVTGSEKLLAINKNGIQTTIKVDKILDKANGMSVDDRKALDEMKTRLDSDLNIRQISEPSMLDFNEYVEQGIYNIHCMGNAINSPINSTGEIKGRLTVLLTSFESSVITQVLNLNNNEGGEGNIYIRSQQNGKWKPWAKLQNNVEVGVVTLTDLDNDPFLDNGIFSGVCSDTGETFVLICINNYAVAPQNKSIALLKYSLYIGSQDGLTPGAVKIEKRSRNTTGFWTDWENIGSGSTLPEATRDTLGGIKIGTALYRNNIKLGIDENSFAGIGFTEAFRRDDAELLDFNWGDATSVSSIAGIPLCMGTAFKITKDKQFSSKSKPVVLLDTSYFSVSEKGLTINPDASFGDSTTKVTWDANSNMNDFKTPGVYEIYGERTVKTDNLPITNDGSGHSIAARLIVVASTLQPANDEIYVTQFLMLSNRLGGDGNMYVRTYNQNNGAVTGAAWSPWQKLMGMVETKINSDDVTVEEKIFSTYTDKIGDGINGMIDNGLYSGIYINNIEKYPATTNMYYLSNLPTFAETFVLIVINDYAATGKLNLPRHITQLKYAVDAFTGQSTVKKRVGTGNEIISWGDWEDINNITIDDKVTTTSANPVQSQAIANAIEEGEKRALRRLFVAAGALYNDTGADKTKTAPWGETVTHKAGHYYLNGLGDITEEQMMEIYINKDIVKMLDIGRIIQGNKMIRTMLPIKSVLVSDAVNKRAFNGLFSCAQSAIEVFCVSILVSLNTISLEHTVSCSTLYGTFFDCSKLRLIYPINVKNVTSISNNTFYGCSSLEELRLFGLATNLNLSDSSNISKDSIVYIVQNSGFSEAKSITLHPDAYARLANDAEIVAALEAQPLITLVSA